MDQSGHQPTKTFPYHLLAIFIVMLVVLPLMIRIGCKPPASSSSAAQTRQVSADEDRAQELEFEDEDGNMDWRGRLDAAKEALEEAQSDSRWGNQDSAIQHALDAARLMPPPGKDFDLPGTPAESSASETDDDSEGDEAGNPADNAETETENHADGGRQVTNQEVEALRASLDELLGSLDGRAREAAGGLRLDRDIIEIE